MIDERDYGGKSKGPNDEKSRRTFSHQEKCNTIIDALCRRTKTVTPFTMHDKRMLQRFMEDVFVGKSNASLENPSVQNLLALREVLKPTLFGILFLMFDEAKGMEAVEKEKGLPARSCKALVKVAIEHMAPFYAER